MNPRLGTIASAQPRRGHAANGAIISDIEPLAEYSQAPGNVYKELQQLENELRLRLNNLNAAKGVPAKMTGYLDELKAALTHAISEGVDANFLIQGMEDILEEKPVAQPAPKPERVPMVPDTKYKKIRAELGESNKKIQKLNEENNALILYIRQLVAERVSRGV